MKHRYHFGALTSEKARKNYDRIFRVKRKKAFPKKRNGGRKRRR